MAKFKISMKAGHFKEGADLKRLIEQELDPALIHGAKAMRDAIRSVTPVVSGNLHNRTDITSPEWEHGLRRISVVADTPYARRVNLTSRKNRGYWEKGVLKGNRATVTNVGQADRGLSAHLWERK